MKIIDIYLTPIEQKALFLFSEGYGSGFIAEQCLPPNGTVPYHLFCLSLRTKTGIHRLQLRAEVLDYLAKMAEADQHPPTEAHVDIMKRILGIAQEEHTFDAAAYRLQKTRPEVVALYSEALRAIGIFSRDPRTQRVQARSWFAAQKPIVQPTEAMTPKQWRTLRMYAAGDSWEAIREAQGFVKEEGIRKEVHRLCCKLGIVSRGRNAQRKLAALAVAHYDAQEAAKRDLDDPFF